MAHLIAWRRGKIHSNGMVAKCRFCLKASAKIRQGTKQNFTVLHLLSSRAGVQPLRQLGTGSKHSAVQAAARRSPRQRSCSIFGEPAARGSMLAQTRDPWEKRACSSCVLKLPLFPAVGLRLSLSGGAIYKTLSRRESEGRGVWGSFRGLGWWCQLPAEFQLRGRCHFVCEGEDISHHPRVHTTGGASAEGASAGGLQACGRERRGGES